MRKVSLLEKCTDLAVMPLILWALIGFYIYVVPQYAKVHAGSVLAGSGFLFLLIGRLRFGPYKGRERLLWLKPMVFIAFGSLACFILLINGQLEWGMSIAASACILHGFYAARIWRYEECARRVTGYRARSPHMAGYR